MNPKKISWFRITKKDKEQKLKKLDPNTRKFAQAALDLGYQVEAMPFFYGLRLKHNGRTVNFINMSAPQNNQSAHLVGLNKYLTNSIWKENGIFVPAFNLVTSKEVLAGNTRLYGLKFPLVIKPAKDTTHGEMVITNIKNKTDLNKYLKLVARKFKLILVEEYCHGLNEYRLLYYKGRILAIAQKIPAYIKGDGKLNIKELIEKKNRARNKFKVHNLKPIIIDTELRNTIKARGFNLKSVLKKEEIIKLKNVANLSAGGEVQTIRKIHPSVRKMAIKAAKVLDLDYCGLDLLAKDITKPLKKGRDVFIEANETPGINLHYDWEKNKMPPIAKSIMKDIFK